MLYIRQAEGAKEKKRSATAQEDGDYIYHIVARYIGYCLAQGFILMSLSTPAHSPYSRKTPSAPAGSHSLPTESSLMSVLSLFTLVAVWCLAVTNTLADTLFERKSSRNQNLGTVQHAKRDDDPPNPNDQSWVQKWAAIGDSYAVS